MAEREPKAPPGDQRGLDGMLHALQERAKELGCIYRIDELVRARERSLDEILRDVVQAIPAGWQYPNVCQAKIVVEGRAYHAPGFSESPWSQGAAIRVHGRAVGSVTVYYTEEEKAADEGPFLKEERRLIDAIAERLALLIEQRAGGPSSAEKRRPGFQVALDILAGTDRKLYRRTARKMLNHLAWRGVEDARQLLQRISGATAAIDENRPLARGAPEDVEAVAPEIFRIAEARLSEAETASCIQGWMREDRVDFLVQALETPYTSLVEIANAMDRFQRSGVVTGELSMATRTGLVTALVRRLLTDHLGFIHVARR
ncbi:MAG TPA: GAF domain-containing protein, partial [Vicinamibacteria bacterium]|nr:GAF domain-containing protein [Vicinamibacteria bacterium]